MLGAPPSFGREASQAAGLRIAIATSGQGALETFSLSRRGGYALAMGLWTMGHLLHIAFISTTGQMVGSVVGIGGFAGDRRDVDGKIYLYHSRDCRQLSADPRRRSLLALLAIHLLVLRYERASFQERQIAA